MLYRGRISTFMIYPRLLHLLHNADGQFFCRVWRGATDFAWFRNSRCFIACKRIMSSFLTFPTQFVLCDSRTFRNLVPHLLAILTIIIRYFTYFTRVYWVTYWWKRQRVPEMFFARNRMRKRFYKLKVENLKKTTYIIGKLRKKYVENVYQTIFLSTF